MKKGRMEPRGRHIAAAAAYDSKRLRFFDVEVREYSVTVSDISSSGTGMRASSV